MIQSAPRFCVFVTSLLVSFSLYAAPYEAFQYLQTTSSSRNVTETHIVNGGNNAQRFTGTLFDSDGNQLGEANQALSSGSTPAKGRLILTSDDFEVIFGISPWRGPATLHIKGEARFDVMSKLTSPSGLISNTNCTRTNAVHNVEGFDSSTLSYVRFINTGPTVLTNITGSLFDSDGGLIGTADQVLIASLKPRAAVWLNRDQLSDIVGGTWNGEALLEITSNHSTLSLLNLNSVNNNDTFFNFSCYEAAAKAPDSTANYRVTFNTEWSSTTHPNAYPSGAHFSPLIGATHNSNVTFWENGGMATTGIEVMAETGSTSNLRSEINTAIDGSTAGSTVSGGQISSPGTLTVDFEVSVDFPLVTLVSMIAPSPDWFVGINSTSLLVNGDWVDTLTLELFAYDAGTEDGTGFSLSNDNTDPQGAITRITTERFPEGSPRLGTFVFEHQD